MKTTATLVLNTLILFALLNTVPSKSFSQQTLTSINGWNAYVHLPDDYNVTGSQKYPAIIFFPGTGEVGTDPSKLLVYGPSHFIAQGRNLNSFIVNGQTIKPIIISVQPTLLYPQPWELNILFDAILSRWRIDPTHFNLTGLSMGGFCGDNFVTESVANASRINSMVNMSAVTINYPISNYSYFATRKGKVWWFEGTYDNRGMDQMAAVMNSFAPGSARYTSYVGGHCCWNTWYDPSYTENVSGQNWNIYQWMLAQNKGVIVSSPPNVSAGSAQTIILPVNSINLTGTASGNGGATIARTSWTENSGPNTGVISSASNLSTTVTGLITGAYVFRLTATDNKGLSNTSTVSVTVNNVLPPTVNAGTSQTITLTAGTAGSQVAKFNFSNASKSISGWTNMAGSPSSRVITATDPSGISLNSVATSNWFPYNGSSSFDGNGVNAAGFFGNSSVSLNNWFQFGDPTALYNSAKAQLQATGLIPGKAYSIKISGSNGTGFNANPTRYTISGLSYYGAIDVKLNGTADNGATFNNIFPDANGKVRIFINAVAGQSALGEVNGIQIISTSVASSQSLSLATASVVLSGSATANKGATIKSTAWSKISGNICTIVSPSNLTTIVSGLGVGIYVFRLSATDNYGLTGSSSVTIIVNPPPTVLADTVKTIVLASTTAEPAAVTDSNAKVISEEKFLVYPNPAIDLVNITWTSSYRGYAGFSLFDISGRLLQTRNITKDQQDYYDHYSFNSLNQGMYILVIKLQDGKSITQKIIKQ